VEAWNAIPFHSADDSLDGETSRLSALGSLNIIDILAGGDILKWDAVAELPFNYGLSWLYRHEELKRLQAEHHKRQMRKQKRK